MDKISLEEFRRLRDIVGEVVEVIKTHGEDYDFRADIEKKYPNIDEILEEYEALGDKDLSDIPFEEYKGFYDVGIDFEGTGAKLDFNYIDLSNRESPVRVKGCEVRNFPFTPGLYDEDSFDEDFLNQFSDKFLSIDLPKDVSGRYYVGRLTISDVLKYDLFDAIEEGKTTKETKDFFNRVDINLIRNVGENLLNNYSVAENVSYFLSKEEGEITEEKYREALKQAVENLIEKSYIDLDRYNEITHIEGIEEFYPSDKIIDFKGNERLYGDYRSGFLDISQLVENKEIFRGKKFVSKLYVSRDEKQEYNEEEVYFILDNYPELAEVLARDTRLLPNFFTKVNLGEDVEENKRSVREEALKIYSDRDYDYFTSVKSEITKILSLDELAKTLGEYDKQYYDTLRERYSEEEISKYEIPNDILFNRYVLRTLNTLGLDKVMEFDANNDHIFSKNNYLLLRIMDDYYFHYSGNNHDSNTNLYTPINQGDMDEFFKRMIKYGPTDYNYKEQPIDFRNFSDEFKSKYPELFISEEAPEELKDLFYSRKLKVTDFKDHSEWIKYFEKTDLNIGMKIEGIYFDVSNTYYNYNDMLNLVTTNGIEKIEYLLDLEEKGYLNIYRKIYNRIGSIPITDEELQDISFEKITEKMDQEIEKAILQRRIPYGENLVTNRFRENHPDLMLSPDAPEELKKKFYSYYEVDGENVAETIPLTIQDWLDKENYKYLEGKDLSHTALASIASNLKLLGREEIEKMVLIDPNCMEFYLSDVNLLNKFSDIIKNYPDKFAKETVSEELKISIEELDSRLEAGDNDLVLKVEDEREKYLAQLIKSPGYVEYYPDEEKDRKSLKEYINLSENNMLKVSNSYVMETYEQILVNMYRFLGFDDAKKLLDVPNIDDETLDGIYEQDELIKSLYEKKFIVKGDLKVVSKFVERIPSILPGNNEKLTTKNTLKVFKGINDEIQNGYDGDIQALLTKVLEKNNMSIDEEKIDELSKALIAISTAQKLELVRENNANVIDERINENDGTRRLIKILYRNAMEYSLSNSEKIDPSLVREYLEKEFSKLNENGLPYYSPHVREHLEEYVEMSKELNELETWSKKINHTIVDDIRSQANLIGKGWIRKIVNYVCNQPENLTYEEITKMEELLYPEGSNVEIDADSIVTVKNLSQEEKEKTYRLLSSGNYAGLLTYSKAENMFSTRNVNYSPAFREFFLKNKDAFISNPKLYTNFQIFNNKFEAMLGNENIRSSFEAGKLDPEDVLLALESEPYPTVNTKPGDDEMIYLAKKAYLGVEQVTKALEMMEQVRGREYQTIPPEETIIDEYRGKILRIDDPRHFTVGNETNCCQKFGNGQPGESSMLHSATERNGSEFIIEKIDPKGDSKAIMSQSWVWRNGNRVTFDNVEIPATIIQSNLVEGGFDKLMDIYVEAAKKIVETDRKKLKRISKTR